MQWGDEDDDDNLATTIIHHDDWNIYRLAGHYSYYEFHHLTLVKVTTGYYNVLCQKKLCFLYSLLIDKKWVQFLDFDH